MYFTKNYGTFIKFAGLNFYKVAQCGTAYSSIIKLTH